MYQYLIYNQLKKHEKAEKGFHVPGHKARGDFKSKFPSAVLDVTELSYSDNLLAPAGVIAAAQKDIADILGAEKSFILTDGSTSGIYAMLYVASKRGSRIIVPRNSHASVWNACRILNLEPVVVEGAFGEGLMTPPSPAVIKKLVEGDKGIAGMVAVSPDYYGRIAPLKEYSKILKANSRLLIVDGAHGSHLCFEHERKGYAGVHADLWVDGVHKSLPSLTQGAIVSAASEELAEELKEGVSMFRTTSPSYPIMASVEYGVKYLSNNPGAILKAKQALADFKERASGLTVCPTDDWTKLLIDMKPLGISADKAMSLLEKRGIYAELSDGRYLLFYLSPMTVPSDMNKLHSALSAVISNKKLKGSFSPRPEIPEHVRTLSYLYALRRPSEEVPLSQAAGRMAACNAGFAPPCIPVVVTGEIITDEAIACLSGKKGVYGISGGKIKVVKK